MSDIRQELIVFRLGRATESLNMASLAIEQKYWNAAASELTIPAIIL